MDNSCAPPAVSVATPAPVNYGNTVTLQAVVTGDGGQVTYQWLNSSNQEIAGARSATYTTPALQASTTYSVVVTSTCGVAESNDVTVSVVVPAPAGLVATVSGAASVALSWTGVGGASKYEIERRAGGTWTAVASPSSSSYTDSACPAGEACVYRVRAVTSGGEKSAFSNVDLATLISFATITEATSWVTAEHFEQVLSAINAIRRAAGSVNVGWASILPSGVPVPAPGVWVEDDHLLALRSAMNSALTAHGITNTTYTDALSQPTLTKALHIRQLQERAK